MRTDIPSRDSLMLYAAKKYKNKAATTSEFMKDLSKLYQIRKSFNAYRLKNRINVRLILNQIVVLSNSFGVSAAVEMLMCETDLIEHSALFPMLIFLGYMTEDQLSDHQVEFDQMIVSELRKL